jgi:DNA invertase Pin-like site-specific DNA recombinase
MVQRFTMNRRVALYARVSTKDRGQDTENQLRQLRQLAGTQGWAIVQKYVDQTTGKRGDREQFQKMFSDASRVSSMYCSSGAWTGFRGKERWKR